MMYWIGRKSKVDMRRLLPLIVLQFGLLPGIRLFADVVTLKDGRQISGFVESGNTRELHINVGDQSQTIDIHEVQAIQFGVSLPAPATTTPPPKAAVPARRQLLRLQIPKRRPPHPQLPNLRRPNPTA